MPEESTPDPERSHERPRRRALVTTLIVIATVLGFFAITAVWVNRQALNTDNWTSSSSKLLESQPIRDSVSAFLVDQLYANVDVEGDLRQALPKQAQPLAGPAAGGLRSLAQQGIEQLLQRPRVQALWEQANRRAHQAFLHVVEGGGGAVSTQGGTVKLDLATVLKQTAKGIGIGQNLVNKLPAGAAQITILRSKQLKTAQDAVDVLRGLAVVLTLLSLALFVIAVAVSGRRREALRGVGIGFVCAGVAALLVRIFGSTAVVDALAKTAAQRPSIEDVVSIETSQLVQAAVAVIAYGVVIMLAAWLAGPTRTAVRLRRWLAPYLRDARYAFGALAVVLVLLIAWGPTPATRNILLLAIMAAALALGVETLRRQTAREYPYATLESAAQGRSEWMARTRESVSGWTRRARSGSGGGAAAGAADDARIAALERLGRLRETGVIDEAEFKQEKSRIMSQQPNERDN